MFDESGFDWKKATLPLFVASVVLTLTQILTVTWCSANGEYYGFWREGKVFHSCLGNMPGDWFFRYGSLVLSSIGLLALFYDSVRAFRAWSETRSINLSRSVFVISMITVTGELEVLTNSYAQHDEFAGIKSWLFDTWFYVFPVALFLLVVSALSISKKLELVFSLNKH